MTNVLVVEDSRIVRESLVHRLAAMEGYELVACIANAANAPIVCMRDHIDLVLMDVCTADDESGLVAAATIKRRHPGTRVVVMTSMPEYSFLGKARDAGCDGFWYKEGDVTLEQMCDAAMAGEGIWPTGTPPVRVGLTSSDEFTPRELSIIRALAEGLRYEEIAGELCLSVNTVKYHVKHILAKTGYRSTVQVVADVVAQRLVLPRF